MGKRFQDDGSPVTVALSWYLEGKKAGLQNGQPPRLFEGVLDNGTPLAQMNSLSNKDAVNKYFNKAIENGEAIAVSYQNGLRAHAVTVWGISVDDVGNVFELWVADSDLQTTGKPHVYNMGIYYDADGYPRFLNLSNDTPAKSNIIFREITTLNLGKNKFQAFFEQHQNGN